MSNFTPGFVTTKTTYVPELTDEDVQWWNDHREELKKGFDEASVKIEEALEAHKEACKKFDEIFRGTKTKN